MTVWSVVALFVSTAQSCCCFYSLLSYNLGFEPALEIFRSCCAKLFASLFFEDGSSGEHLRVLSPGHEDESKRTLLELSKPGYISFWLICVGALT